MNKCVCCGNKTKQSEKRDGHCYQCWKKWKRIGANIKKSG
ncbi:DUF2797 domain-containing protein [Pontibacillus halophilus]|nr:DUF2797 domain-containing protein [Pontibacillus halophilus]